MIDLERLRARIDQEFDGECHLTSAEARLLFDVFAAAGAWRDTGTQDGAECLRATRALLDAVDAARGAP